eukprot:Phypoly_transcript_15526.p1 GENE.Phypoly_transcript_15526~~Phypoly_transcript_15526.p1  ORF type:complete len:282 (+),score=35.63 Phypoly_transcript_15526:66-911(+)
MQGSRSFILFSLLLPTFILFLHFSTPVDAWGAYKKDPYYILGLPPGAPIEEVKKAHKQLALKWHPDKHENSPESQAKYREISEAYRMIGQGDIQYEITTPFAEEGFTIEVNAKFTELLIYVFFAITILVKLFYSWKTSKNVKRSKIEFSTAPGYKRALAGGIDVMIYQAMSSMIRALAVKLWRGETHGMSISMPMLGLYAIYIIFLLFGKSYGKFMCGIRVVDQTTKKDVWGLRFFAREVISKQLLFAFDFFAYFMGATITDRVFRTVVGVNNTEIKKKKK